METLSRGDFKGGEHVDFFEPEIGEKERAYFSEFRRNLRAGMEDFVARHQPALA